MHIVLLWICVCSHLLQEEAILTFESVEIVVWSYLECCQSISTGFYFSHSKSDT